MEIVNSALLRARAEEAVLEESPWKRGSIAPLSRTTRTRLLALPGGETEELGRSTETEARPAREMAALVKVVVSRVHDLFVSGSFIKLAGALLLRNGWSDVRRLPWGGCFLGCSVCLCCSVESENLMYEWQAHTVGSFSWWESCESEQRRGLLV